MAKDKQPPRSKKYYRSTKSGAGMTRAGVARYRRDNPGSKLKTAVTGKVKKGPIQIRCIWRPTRPITPR